MYRRGRYREVTTITTGGQAGDKSELNTLVGMARSEASLVPSLTAMAKEEAVMERFSEKEVEVERLDFRVSDL